MPSTNVTVTVARSLADELVAREDDLSATLHDSLAREMQ